MRAWMGLAGLFVVLGTGWAQPNPYATVENWAKLPDGRVWGSTSAVDIDRDGKSVWVGERCGANSCEGKMDAPILKFDASGKLVKSFGEGMFIFPHGIYVDKDGDVWVTDGQGKGGKGHQVFKFSPEGKVLMSSGRRVWRETVRIRSINRTMWWWRRMAIFSFRMGTRRGWAMRAW
jgi:hypothetical protein